MQYHLLKADGEWQLREEGTSDALFGVKTKDEALDKLNDYMSSRDGSVAVHKTNGEIQEHRTYTDAETEGASRGNGWAFVGVAAVAVVAVAGAAWYFRGSIPTDRWARQLSNRFPDDLPGEWNRRVPERLRISR